MPTTVPARLSVTTGPDRGKTFELREELVHVGKGPDNQVVLTDSTLSDHSLSIVRRNGRYAVYTTVPEGLDVEGTRVPPERWVWLPAEAQIRISRRTALQFVSTDGAEGDRSDYTASQSADRQAHAATVVPGVMPVPALERAHTERSGEEKSKRKRNVARFITDGPGEPLVKLGADGHLPELRLAALGQTAERHEPVKKQSNPLLLVGVLGFSLCFSLLMAFMEFESAPDTQNKTNARADLVKYLGEEDEALEPYQIALRRARQAYSRRDYDAERAEYRTVLTLLRAEGKRQLLSGLTGNKRGRSDDELESLLGTLLAR